MILTPTNILCLLAIVLPRPATAAQAETDAKLVGSWTCTAGSQKGRTIEITKDSIVSNGHSVPLRFPSPGVFVVGPPGEEERATYKISGATLTVKDSDETSTWRRVTAGRPAADIVQPSNPLGGTEAPAADPFARSFQGDGVHLTLSRSGASGYRGTLTFRGAQYPIKARATGNALGGSFRVSGRDFDFSAELTGDRMTFKTGGKKYQLSGKKLERANPLSRGGNPYRRRSIAAANLTVVQEAGLACVLPKGWTLLNKSAQGCVINPGFQKGQTLQVTMSLHCLPIGPTQQTTNVKQFLLSQLPATRQSLLAKSGIQTRAPDEPVELFDVLGKPAAAVHMRAKTRQGQDGTIWLALRIDDGKCLVGNAIFLGDNERAYLPNVRKVFASLRRASAKR